LEKKNVSERARDVVRELVPVLQTIRECDESLSYPLKRAALNVASDWGYIESITAARFVECAVDGFHSRAREIPVGGAELESARISLAEPHADAKRAFAVPRSFPSASAMLRTTLFIARWI
jgi:hypothetical protein